MWPLEPTEDSIRFPRGQFKSEWWRWKNVNNNYILLTCGCMLLQSAQIKVKQLLVDDKITSCVREIGLLGIKCLLEMYCFLAIQFYLSGPGKSSHTIRGTLSCACRSVCLFQIHLEEKSWRIGGWGGFLELIREGSHLFSFIFPFWNKIDDHV